MDPTEEDVRLAFEYLETQYHSGQDLVYNNVDVLAVPLVLGFWRGVGRHAYAYNIMDAGNLRIVIEVQDPTRNIEFSDRFENHHQLL